MSNPLSKTYTGPFYIIALVLSAIASVLTSPELADLGLPALGPIATALSALALLLQRLTPIGD